jgi:electron transport complex protein RnfE
MTKKENFLKGLIKENPIFVSLLGMCPALAVTSSFETAIGMGLLVIFVLTMSNLVISLLRNVIPSDVRTPAYIVIIATFVTIVRMATEAVSLSLYDALGVFIPLIVVNCVILGRAEAFASKNKVTDSILDGLGMGLGFTLALAVIGTVRELLATGGIMMGNYLTFLTDTPFHLFTIDWVLHLFNDGITVEDYMLPMFGVAPGAFIALGLILAVLQNKTIRKEKRIEEEKQRMIEEKKRIALEKKKALAAKKVGEN